MLIWVALFLVVFLISLVLAFKSLSDYRENPLLAAVPYSVYLIQKPENLKAEVLKDLHTTTSQNKLLVSFERLSRGERKALVVFGPPSIMHSFSTDLGLLELEDYSQKLGENFLAWEVGKKRAESKIGEDVLSDLPKLDETDQFWWQLVLSPKGKSNNDLNFTVAIRAVLQDGSGKRLQDLKEIFGKIGEKQGLAVLPQSYSSAQIAKFYQQRSMPKAMVGVLASKSDNKHESTLTLSALEILKLLGL